ncbi:uncharacterized protein Dwil_GK22385 [Drosophila willistoni]|uniref:Rho-GAP domain-containing protein n=1 Tax=Drosophila willistoni TaxID=7260 RepID=B4NG96_DROWI|nr:ralA-binding protein 1 [Drosophila willistoni]EDW83313.1 uncharacterized protein Dwil_GK22385 [Drosophila willistoni]
MDFDSPEEKEFPGLYASQASDAKSKKSKEESDYSEGDDKPSKKDLLRRKEKKEKGKDRGYAALEGESSPEEEPLDTKSPSKSKKSKTFKFTSSKSKEKREKSRDKDKMAAEKDEEPSSSHHHKSKDKDKEEKKKDKERKEKDKKEKSEKKEKIKKLSKSQQSQQQQQEEDENCDQDLALGYPVFGVSISLATERSRCHDGVDLPLVVRDCIDYLQENSLKCEQIYKVEPIRSQLMHYKRLYNNREYDKDVDEMTLPTACSLLKLFYKELPEPVLTTDLVDRFEMVATHSKPRKHPTEFQELIELLPKCNRTLLAWTMLHFEAVIKKERFNKLNAQSLAMLLSPTLQMSHRLMVAFLCNCHILFSDVTLIKYVPPLTSSSPNLPELPDDIQVELKKQDSLLTQIHSEMNAGFITKKREEQLWEVQRIITQLKRKLRTFERKQEKSIEELDSNQATQSSKTATSTTTALSHSAPTGHDTTDSQTTTATAPVSTGPPLTSIVNEEQEQKIESTQSVSSPTPEFSIDPLSGYVLLPKSNPQRDELLRLQIEYDELMGWQNEIKARILSERNEIFRLKQLYDQQQMLKPAVAQHSNNTPSASAMEHSSSTETDYEKIIEHYTRENTLLEHKKIMLANALKEEKKACIALQVELRLQEF